MLLSTLSVLVAFGLPSALAKQTFSNNGTRTGWDGFTHEHKGTVDEVSDVVYKGSTALKMTQIYDSSYTGRYHSEALKHDVYKKGDTGSYGFAFQLQKDWEFTKDVSFNLAQFIADFSDLGCEETYMPSTMISIVGDQLAARVKTGSVCPTSAQKTTKWAGLAKVSAGVWHTVVIQARWESDESGFFRIWFDGKQVHEETGIKTTVSDGRAFDFRVGLYANGWHDNGYSGNQPTRTVWYDQIAVGSDMADADPGKW
ncbi:hypothetical protein SUNI508_12854 [Seiridium unicorne]|uniref:Polysaccharide lyase n=1 Tax=Seiridium unicorne TaxID=138068 RepID=A0ABR2VHA2_9PEZI